MRHLRLRRPISYLLLSSTMALCLMVNVPETFAKGDLSEKQVRKLVAGMPGFSLQSKSVHVISLRSLDAATVQGTAEIALAFRFEKDERDWRVAEVRTGREQWERVDLLTRVLKVGQVSAACTSGPHALDLDNRQARCLLAEMLAVQMPSDSIRIKDISTLALPLGSKASALIDALITADFQFSKTEKTWVVSGIRTGTGNWIDPRLVVEKLQNEKITTARADLDVIATALEKFRRSHGSYVESKSQRVLIDFLSPRYLATIIRLDPWRHPYRYEGTVNAFTLRSVGPDGQENTADDIVLGGPARSAVN